MQKKDVKTAASAWRKIASVFLCVILSLVFLEVGLRLGGFVKLALDEYDNSKSIKQKNAYRILCLGDSTTNAPYPHLLDQILNERNIGVRFSVINKGKGGADTVFILNQVESYLAKYHPDMVVAMMGNDDKNVGYFQDLFEGDTWIFRHSLLYRFGRMRFAHILKQIKREEIYGLSGSHAGGKAKPEDGGAVSEKANTENVAPLDLKAAKGAQGPPRSYLKGLKLSSAQKVLGKDVELHHGNDNADVELGRLYQEQGKFQQAENSFKKAIEMNPENDRACIWLGLLYRKQGKFQQAEDSFKKAMEMNPESERAYTELGQLYRQQGQFLLAEDSYRKAFEIDPKNDTAIVELGSLYGHRGEFAQAEDSLKKAIEINPKSDKAYTELGQLYREQGKFLQAEDSYRKAIEIDPKNDNSYAGLGWLYRAQDKFSQAEESFKKTVEMNPKNDRACIWLGLLYRKQGKFQQAEDSFTKAIEINPKNDRAYTELGQLYREQGKFLQGEDSYRKAIGINPKNEQALRAMPSLFKEMGKPGLAKEYAEKVNGLSSNYPAVTVNNYRKLKEILDGRGIKLVCVQYPMRDVAPLKRIFENEKGLIFVDNERLFKEAVKKGSFKEYFYDRFAGDFGHCTVKGDTLLAKNIADAILKEVFSK